MPRVASGFTVFRLPLKFVHHQLLSVILHHTSTKSGDPQCCHGPRPDGGPDHKLGLRLTARHPAVDRCGLALGNQAARGGLPRTVASHVGRFSVPTPPEFDAEPSWATQRLSKFCQRGLSCSIWSAPWE